MAFFRSSGIALVIVAIASGCWRTDNQALNEGDTDTDTDSDSDGDTDSDSDSDGDTDGDSDTDTWPDPDTAPDGYGEIVEVCWATVVESTDYAHAMDLVVLADGSSVLAGRFTETVTFDPGGSGEIDLQASAGDHFLAGFDPDGSFRWVRQLDVGDVNDIEADGEGSAVVLGRYQGAAVLSVGEPDETVLEGIGDIDLFLARYDADGSIDWARRDGGQDDVMPAGLGLLGDSSYVVAGKLNGATTFGAGEEHETIIDQGPGTISFIAAYREDGTVLWAKSDCDGCSPGMNVAGNPAEGIFMVTGFYHWQATFGLGGENETTLLAADYGASEAYDSPIGVFFSTYDVTGELLRVESAGSSFAFPYTYATALSGGSFIASGYYYSNLCFEYGLPGEECLQAPVQDSATFQPGMFAARFDEGGDLAWVKGTQSGFGSMASGSRAVSLADNSYVIPGMFVGAVGFDLGEPAETWLVASNFGEPYGAVYDENGDLAWVARIGANWTDGGAVAAAGLGDGNFLMAGQFQGGVDFQVGPDHWETYDAGEGSDVFLAKVCPQF